MKNQIRNFIEILKLEMEDLQDDIRTLKQICEERFNAKLITNYVHMENMALYDNELHAIGSFRKIIEDVDYSSYQNLSQLIDHIDEKFYKVMKSCGYAEAGHICIKRKILKVAKYVDGKYKKERC